MKIDFNQVPRTLNGNDFTEPDGTLVMLKVICETALLDSDTPDLHGSDKFVRFEIASKIHGGGEVELDFEEVNVIAEVVGKKYPTPIVGPVYRALGLAMSKVSPKAPVGNTEEG